MNNKSKSSITGYAKGLMTAGPKNPVAQGLELSVSTILGKTLLRRLPVPLNFAVPLVTEKIIMKHGVPYGRDVLIKALKWVKQATEEKPTSRLASDNYLPEASVPAAVENTVAEKHSFGNELNR
ncbi:hypothetical protein [Dyadobacter tibetensis]|uniref:hypothetical protein n=1 Tax=Dyadobacter tibetensis TaxID=1211851 RepID=UPI00046EF3C5|nr:hypothetical protein [Dyadobacter tibetensis]